MGKDVMEAKENAKVALGVGPLDDVNFEIIHAGSKGIFGIIGVKKAQVKAWIELPDTVAPRQHGDSPKALEFVRSIRKAFEESGIEVKNLMA